MKIDELRKATNMVAVVEVGIERVLTPIKTICKEAYDKYPQECVSEYHNIVNGVEFALAVMYYRLLPCVEIDMIYDVDKLYFLADNRRISWDVIHGFKESVTIEGLGKEFLYNVNLGLPAQQVYDFFKTSAKPFNRIPQFKAADVLKSERKME